MRRYLLFLSGLVLCTSPLYAQEYIDLEAERSPAERSPAEGSPAYSNPADRSPTDGSPTDGSPTDTQPGAASPGSTIYLDSPPEPQPGAAINPASNPGELLYQLQLLQQEVMELRGRVEEQNFQIRQLKQQSLERYQDIDSRLAKLAVGGVPAANPGTGPVTRPGPRQELPGEANAYRSAYSQVRSQQFESALASFRQFLQDFPDGKFAPNAHYWLGELFLVINPPDLESSRREFVLLIEQFPENSKVPDALYKLGKVYFEKGNRDRSREYLDRVIRDYADSNSSAVNLAREFLLQNF